MKKNDFEASVHGSCLRNSCVGIFFFSIVGIYVLTVAVRIGDVLSRLLSV